MTKESIEHRIAQLEAQREEMVAQLNACLGAIQDCRYWLGVLNEQQSSKSA